MNFSGKITSSVVSFLVEKGEDLNALQEFSEIPMEFLRDPTAWSSARQVEDFLAAVENEYSHKFPGQNLMHSIGHKARDLKSWGVLDSVLKMMSRPQDIFVQPGRFISYFINPPPPIMERERTEESLQIELPISHEEFPCVTAYLQAAIEALPTFMGLEHCQVSWKDTKLSVSWSTNQSSFFASEEDGRNIRPEFMQSLVEALESKEKALEEKKREIERIRNENERAALSFLNRDRIDLDQPLSEARQQFMRMSDYFTRSRQLITLLIGQDRMNAQVKEAMRRVDWATIEEEFPEVLARGIEGLDKTRDALQTKEEEKPRSPSCPQLSMFTPEKF